MIRIPQRTIDTIDDYYKRGLQPGSFVRAVLENDLKAAFSCADMENRLAMFDIVQYVYNNLPIGCYGSPKLVDEWLVYIREVNKNAR